MLKIKVTLMRSPSLHDFGPEEDKVFGTFKDVQITYDILRVEGEYVGIYDDERGGWILHSSTKVPQDLHDTGWSDIHLEPVEE